MEKKFAVFVDGDNISSNHYENILLKTQNHGEIHEARVYTDWEESKKPWKEKLLKHPAREVQVTRYGLNATDFHIYMDVVEMISSNPNIDAFCIASTDSDYLFLARRLRVCGKYVLGIGAANAKKEWQDSCDDFVILENGSSHSVADEAESLQDNSQTNDLIPDSIVEDGFEKARSTGKADIDGWVIMNDFASTIEESDPGLWQRLGGNHRKALEDYAKTTGRIEIDETIPGKYRIRLNAQNDSAGQTNSIRGLDGILGYGFNHANPDKDGWCYVASFLEAVKKYCPSFKKNPNFWEKEYGSKPQKILEKYEEETGKIEIDKTKTDSWRIRQKPQEQMRDNSTIPAV
jgi:hypothetical protein